MVLNYHDGDFNRSGSQFNTNGTNRLINSSAKLGV